MGRKMDARWIDMIRMVDGWYGIDMYVIRSVSWLGFS